REIGGRIAGCVRGSDLVARLGGDEFVALIESVSAPQALHEIAQKIIEAVAHPLALDRRELALSVSIGVVTMPGDGSDAATLMRNADVAMYRAKGQGRNRYSFYTREMSEHADERLALELDLHRAIERGELRVLYQPKVAVADGGIRGAEALLRWQHPRLGLLAPNRFIDLAEETGAIVPIGRWVLKEACARAAAWDGSYSIAVNLSARQFSDPGLLATVEEALRESGLDPALLELEITESMVMLEPEAAAQTMRKLRALGTRLSMDDFGTGYSSLGYLKRFPITTVKLDRSFVRDLPDHEDDVAIARAVLAMAHSLRMDVTAEGLETIARACKAISTRVNKGALADGLGAAGTDNIQGEAQKKLDVLSNEILMEANVWGGNLAAFASEEVERPVPITEPYKRGEYLLLIDPLDGSSNIDVNISVGTIFSVLRCPKTAEGKYCEPEEAAFLQPGS